MAVDAVDRCSSPGATRGRMLVDGYFRTSLGRDHHGAGASRRLLGVTDSLQRMGGAVWRANASAAILQAPATRSHEWIPLPLEKHLAPCKTWHTGPDQSGSRSPWSPAARLDTAWKSTLRYGVYNPDSTKSAHRPTYCIFRLPRLLQY
jgi:hypothetical protein